MIFSLKTKSAYTEHGGTIQKSKSVKEERENRCNEKDHCLILRTSIMANTPFIGVSSWEEMWGDMGCLIDRESLGLYFASHIYVHSLFPFSHHIISGRMMRTENGTRIRIFKLDTNWNDVRTKFCKERFNPSSVASRYFDWSSLSLSQTSYRQLPVAGFRNFRLRPIISSVRPFKRFVLLRYLLRVLLASSRRTINGRPRHFWMARFWTLII